MFGSFPFINSVIKVVQLLLSTSAICQVKSLQNRSNQAQNKQTKLLVHKYTYIHNFGWSACFWLISKTFRLILKKNHCIQLTLRGVTDLFMESVGQYYIILGPYRHSTIGQAEAHQNAIDIWWIFNGRARSDLLPILLC